jgi:pentatricopeptide repeat protein
MGIDFEDITIEAMEYTFYFLINSGKIDEAGAIFHSGKIDEASVILDYFEWSNDEDINNELIKRRIELAKRRMAVKLIISYCKAGRYDDGLRLLDFFEDRSHLKEICHYYLPKQK